MINFVLVPYSMLDVTCPPPPLAASDNVIDLCDDTPASPPPLPDRDVTQLSDSDCGGGGDAHAIRYTIAELQRFKSAVVAVTELCDYMLRTRHKLDRRAQQRDRERIQIRNELATLLARLQAPLLEYNRLPLESMHVLMHV